jgi:hypothetical protein
MAEQTMQTSASAPVAVNELNTLSQLRFIQISLTTLQHVAGKQAAVWDNDMRRSKAQESLFHTTCGGEH